MTFCWSRDLKLTTEMTKHKVFNISGMSPFPYSNHDFKLPRVKKTYRHRVVEIYISNHIGTRCNHAVSTYVVDSVSDWTSASRTAGGTADEQIDSSLFKSLFLLIALLKNNFKSDH